MDEELTIRVDIYEDLTDATGIAEREHYSIFIENGEGEDVDKIMQMIDHSKYFIKHIYDFWKQEYQLNQDLELELIGDDPSL